MRWASSMLTTPKIYEDFNSEDSDLTRKIHIYLDFQSDDLSAIPGYGSPTAQWMVIGQAPPMRTKSTGVALNMPFGEASIKALRHYSGRWFTDNPYEGPKGEATSFADVYFTHLVKHPTPIDKAPPIKEIRRALPKLFREIKAIGPKRILVLGSVAAAHLCPGFENMTEDHGTIFYNPELNAHLVPTYELPTVAYREPLRPIFKRDLQRFFDLPNPVEPGYTLTTLSEVKFTPGSSVVLDIETNSLDPYNGQILSVGMLELGSNDKLVKIALAPAQTEIKALLDHFVKDGITLIIHNAQFDLYFLAVKGEHKLEGLLVEDTMILAHHSGEDTLNLKHLTTVYTDRPGSHAFGSFEDLNYLAEDVLSTAELYPIFSGKVGDVYARRLINDIIPPLINVRIDGVHVDRNRLLEANTWQKTLVEERLSILKAYSEETNWDSPKEVGLKMKSLGIPLTERTKTDGWKVGEPILLPLQDDYPLVKAFLEYKDALGQEKFTKGYLEDTREDHPFLHPKLILTGTTTGRLSCREPNLQQVPRVGPAKQSFNSRHKGGYIGLVDLSQAELRVAALLCGDENFAQMLMSGDAHRSIASQLWGIPEDDITSAQRKKSKGATFGLLYGGSAEGLGHRIGAEPAEVAKIMKGFFAKFPKLMEWLVNIKKFGVANGYVETAFGRRRDLTELMLTEGIRSVERKSANTPIQGTASDIALTILKNSWVGFRKQKLITSPILGVHDSVLIDIPNKKEIPKAAAIVQEAFVSLRDTPLADFPLYKVIPFEGELIVADSWATAESTNEAYKPYKTFPCSSHVIKEN